jgi:hypothetical protein
MSCVRETNKARAAGDPGAKPYIGKTVAMVRAGGWNSHPIHSGNS